MIRWTRLMESCMDLCSLPSPHRIPHSVAGMAFNFSKVELPHPAARRNAAKPEEGQADSAASGRVEGRRSHSDIPQ
jgi:hypothetical protein